MSSLRKMVLWLLYCVAWIYYAKISLYVIFKINMSYTVFQITNYPRLYYAIDY